MSLQASVDYQKSITDGLTSVATFVPKLLGFLVLLALGYLVAKVVAKVVDRALERVGFDQAVEKGGVRKALAKSQYDASDIVAKIAFYAVFIPFLSAAVGTLGIAALEQPLTSFITLLPKIAVALVLVVVGMAVATAAKKLIEGSLGGLSYGSLLANAAAVFVALGFVKAALDEVGVATQVTTPILIALLATAGGVVVVGVGGGLIGPMSQRWEDVLNRAADEAQNVKQQAQASRGAQSVDEDVYPTTRTTRRTTAASRRG